MIEIRAIKEPLYKSDVAILSDYGGVEYKITLHRVLRTKGLEVDKEQWHKKGEINQEKLECNIIRAKQRVREYAICNEWEHFVTLTIDKAKYDRKDLKSYYKDFSQWLRNYSKRQKTKIRYIFIPELHKDGQAWHMHGFISGIPEKELIINKNGYLDWEPYKNKFGYISIDKIKDRAKVANYITKYISKNLSDCIKDLNAKMYYISRGLKSREEIKRGSMKSDFIEPDFENEWVKVKTYSPKNSKQSLIELID